VSAVSRRALLSAALAALCVACSEPGGTPQAQAPTVALAPVLVQDVTDHIEATGQLVAPDQATLAAEVAGRVTEIRIDEGSSALQGDVIVTIDPERRELELASARARLAETRVALAELKRERERVRKLHRQKVAAQARLEQAQTELELGRARLDAARAQEGVAKRALADANLTAPFPGLIARRFVSAGEFVQVGQPLVELVALDPIEVEFRLAEQDSSRVELGQQVTVRVAPYPDEVFHATVTVISPTIDQRTRTLRVKGRMANPDGRLRPGLFARADLGVNQRSGVRTIPEEAILQRSDGAVVFRLDEDSRVERRVIAPGLHLDGRVEVLEGLAHDDRVVVRGHASLIDGSRVAVRNPDGSPVAPSVAGSPDGP